MSHRFAIFIYIFTALFFGAFFVLPIWEILQGAFFDADGSFTIAYVIEVFANPIYLEGLRNAFFMAVFSTLLSFLIAMPLAFLSDRFIFPGKTLFAALILVPIILPPFVGAIGVKQILGQYGALNVLLTHIGILSDGATIDWLGTGRFWGVVIMNALHLYPIFYLNLVASLANVDPAMEEAAENLGCTGFRKFRKVTLPLIRPGIFAGGTIVFIWSFTELGVPLIFDYTRITSVQIFDGIKDLSGNPFPFALVFVMLAAAILFYALGKGFFGRHHYSMMAKAISSSGPKKISPLAAWGCTFAFAAVTFIAVLPHMGVIFISLSEDWYRTLVPTEWTLRNYEIALAHPLTVSSIGNSLKYASISAILDVFLGICIAYVVVRTKLPGRNILDAMAMLPLAVPGLVIAFGYLAMTQEGKFFNFLNPVEDPTVLLIIAYAIRRLPYMVRAAAAGFQQTSEVYEEAAQNLGCPPLKAMFKVTLPLITANIMAGALLCFAFAMLEVSDSLILAQQQMYYPITKAIYELFQVLGDGRFIAAALGVWAMVFLALTIFATSILLGKKLGAIFRV
ncbi:MAG: iron ABC transporter permease [Opitutales bacterium]|nr:iron ABC transporter permease [Opitutales bacterium]